MAEHYGPDSHPLNIPRTKGFISEGGLVFCGRCACTDAMDNVGYWSTHHSYALLSLAGWTPFSTDEWCSKCDTDINPHI